MIPCFPRRCPKGIAANNCQMCDRLVEPDGCATAVALPDPPGLGPSEGGTRQSKPAYTGEGHLNSPCLPRRKELDLKVKLMVILI